MCVCVAARACCRSDFSILIALFAAAVCVRLVNEKAHKFSGWSFGVKF